MSCLSYQPSVTTAQQLGRVRNPLLAICFSLAMLMACAEDDTRLSGKRERLLPDTTTIRNTIITDNLTIAPAVPCANWPQIHNNVRHVQGHCSWANSADWDLATATITLISDIHTPLLFRRMEFVAPVISDGIVYLQISGQRVEARKLDDPRILIWSRRIADDVDNLDTDGGGLSLDDGRLFVTSGHRSLLALDLEDGSTLWQAELPEMARSAPIAAEGRVYVKGASGIVSAYDSEYGNRLWATLDNDPTGIKLMGGSSPAYARETGLGYHLVLAGLPNGRIVALRPDSGIKVWEESLRSSDLVDNLTIDDIGASPVISGNQVIVANLSQGISSLSLVRGTVQWKQPISLRTTPWLSGSTIFTLGDDDRVSALRLDDGSRYWTHALPSEDGEYWFGPVLVSKHLLLFSSQGWIRAINPLTGKLISERQSIILAATTPIVAGDTIFIPTRKGSLAVLR